MDFDYKVSEGSSNESLADEYLEAVDQGALQFGFSSLKFGKNDTDGNCQDVIQTIRTINLPLQKPS